MSWYISAVKYLSRSFSNNAALSGGRRGLTRIAIVGSGPAGFYTAHHLIKQCNDVHVDIFEALPVPFGLIRFGIAPDHPEVKNVINQFTTLALTDRCRFIGNINIGTDIDINKLRLYYNGVVLAYGAEEDKTMGIKGEDSYGVFSARSFVSWYNGLPGYENLNPNLSSGDTAVIIGQGNVALDVARILLTPLDILKETDICSHAVEALSFSKIKKVIMVGRRGPLQVAFTIKELREMIKLPQCKTLIKHKDMLPYKDVISELPRPRKRLTELMLKTSSDGKDINNDDNVLELLFCRSPMEIITRNEITRGIKLEINELIEDSNGGNTTAIGSGEYETIDCSMILRSIGYKSRNIDPEIPFNEELGIINNSMGRVVNNGTTINGLYCSGWVKRGPTGVILSTMNDAFETAGNIVQDKKNGMLPSSNTDRDILIDVKGLEPVLFDDWLKIDEEEKRRGELVGKPREKIVSVQEMLQIIKNNKN